MTKSLLAVCILITTALSAQNIDFTGTYSYSFTREDGGTLTRVLTVLPDNTFQFENKRENWDLDPLKIVLGKGTWTAKGKYIYFTTNPETEIDEKHTLNFTSTEGRWDARNDRIILYKSDIFWLKRFTIEKQ